MFCATPTHDRATQPSTTVARDGHPGRSVGLFFAFMLFLAAPAEAQFSVQPVIMEIEVGDSAAVTSFAVRNESDGPLHLRIYAADFDQPEDGSHAFMEAGTHPRSCADRLQVSTDNLSLQEGGQGEVRVRMAPGASTCWSMVFVQSQALQPDGIRIAQRIGVKVYGIGGLAAPAGEISAVAVETMAPESRTLAITFDNTGDGPLRPEGEVEIRTLDGDIVAVVPVPPFSVLPGRARRTRVALDAELPPGRYLAIPILDFGADYLAGGQATFEVGG